MSDSGEGPPARQKKEKLADAQGLSSGLKPPQAVQQICNEGTALQWDAVTSSYHVLNGEEFVRRFDELRCKREREEGAQTPKRPFSTMCRYYTLLTGDGYAKTGCRFREKEGSTAVNQPVANEKAAAVHMHSHIAHCRMED